MYRARDFIVKSLEKTLGARLLGVFDKSAETLKIGGEKLSNQALRGEFSETLILEQGLKFKVNFAVGQKTGFFLDQRENRKILKSFSAGRRVLNAFSYTGAFSAYALAGGASFIESVDASEWALENLRHNLALNLIGCLDLSCEFQEFQLSAPPLKLQYKMPYPSN